MPPAAPPASVAGVLWQRGNRRGALRHRAALCCAQSGAGTAGGEGEDWPWSSTCALIAGQDDHVVQVAPALERVGDFAAFLGEAFDEALSYAALRRAESVGRPIGSSEWLADLEQRAGRVLAPQKWGPKRWTEVLQAALPA